MYIEFIDLTGAHSYDTGDGMNFERVRRVQWIGNLFKNQKEDNNPK